MYPNTMITSAVVATSAKIAIWMRIRRVKIMSGPLIPSIGNQQRVAQRARATCRARARQLADSAAPLQLQPRQIALPPCSGEESGVDPAERQVDDQGQIGVVATLPGEDLLFGERERGQEAQRTRQRRTRVGKRFQYRPNVFELLDQRFLGLVDRVGGQRAELAELRKRL